MPRVVSELLKGLAMTKAQISRGKCKGCGRDLIIERGPGTRFVSRHEAPTCPSYDAAMALLPRPDEVTVDIIANDSTTPEPQ